MKSKKKKCFITKVNFHGIRNYFAINYQEATGVKGIANKNNDFL